MRSELHGLELIVSSTRSGAVVVVDSHWSDWNEPLMHIAKRSPPRLGVRVCYSPCRSSHLRPQAHRILAPTLQIMRGWIAEQ